MSSVSVGDSVSQDDLSELGSEHRNTKMERNRNPVGPHKVSGQLLHLKIAKINKIKNDLKTSTLRNWYYPLKT